MSRCNEIKKLNNLPKNKYIYQRHEGMITKYIQKEGYYIDCATGIGTKIEEHLLLGKISYNLIDLIECGDYVNGIRILDITGDYVLTAEYNCCKQRLNNKIKTILTKEQYERNCFKELKENANLQ